VKVLFDTHALLWFLQGDPKLPRRWQTLGLDPKDEMYVSIASFWEIGIKLALGKLEVSSEYSRLPTEIVARGITWLPITHSHCIEAVGLPWHHRDPFDRMLAAQAIVEKVKILTNDDRLPHYTDCVWD
jgi:PIN domain nuclease of toxin-antitoxin system